MTSTPKKDVLYIDSDDDITTVIDKVSSSTAGILALVLPKRYVTLKSSVNMKLLKKTADQKKRKLVLITEDSALLPLAGSVGIHVADSLKSRPALPIVPKPTNVDTKPTIITADDSSETESEDVLHDDESTSKDDSKKAAQVGATKKSKSAKSSKISNIKSNSKIKVPNFGKFRNRIILAVALLILIVVGWIWAFKIVPSAKISIQSQTSRVDTDFEIKLRPNAESDNIEKKIIKGEVKEVSKTVTERFDATGKKDVGKKASGTMTVQNCDSSDPFTLPKGTTFSDQTTGLEFKSDKAVEVPGGSFSGGGCNTPGEEDVKVTAVEGGDDKNLSSRSYDVSGTGSLVTAFGGNMSGGTSDIKKVVTASDISAAKQAILNNRDEKVKSELASKFNATTIVVDETFDIANSEPVESVSAGTEADDASVSAEFTYSMIGIKREVMEKVLKDVQEAEIDTDALSILDNGIEDIVVRVKEANADDEYVLTARTNGFAGPEIDVDALKQEITGKRYSEAIEIIQSKPGVKEADVEFSPFWVFSVPGIEKTDVEIEIDDSLLQ